MKNKKWFNMLTASVLALFFVFGNFQIVFAANNWTDVSTYAQFKSALEAQDITHIHFLNDIQLEEREARISPLKPELVIDGNGYTLKEPETTSITLSYFPIQYGVLRDITVQNMNIIGRKLGIIGIPAGYPYSYATTLTYDNVTYTGPSLASAADSKVVFRNCDINIVPGYSNVMGNAAFARHIRLEGNINIVKNAPNSDKEIFYVMHGGAEGSGGLTVASGAKIDISNNRSGSNVDNSGFVYMHSTGGYLNFEDNSSFNYVGNNNFQEAFALSSIYIGKNSEVNIETHGNFYSNGSILGTYGIMTVDEGAVFNVIALDNKTTKPAVVLNSRTRSEQGSILFNNPKSVFIYNSATDAKNTYGLAIATIQGLDVGGVMPIKYENVKSVEYWNLNTARYDNLPLPKYNWYNPNGSPFSANIDINARDYSINKVTLTGYQGLEPINASTALLKGVNVIRINGGSAIIPVINKVTFEANGGSPVPAQQSVQSGGKVTKPADPDRSGYVFAGWYPAPDFSGNAWDFNNDTVTADMVLYAKWNPSASVITGDAVNIAANSAAIDNNTYSGITGTISFVAVQYSTSPTMASPTTTVRAAAISSPYSVDLTGLQPNTTYYYRAGVNASSVSTFGAVKSFTTPPENEMRTVTVNHYTEKTPGAGDYTFNRTEKFTAFDGDVIIGSSLEKYLGSSYVFSHASPVQLTVTSGSNVINMFYKMVRN